MLKQAKEAVESESQRENILSRPGTGFGEMCEEDYITTVSPHFNTGDQAHLLVLFMDYDDYVSY